MTTVVVSEDVRVVRRLGLPSGISYIVGLIIGSGIFISPKGVLLGTGSVGLCLIVWLVCGVLSFCGSLVYCELGLLIPKSGGDYSYLLKTYGTFPAFWFVWVQSLVCQPGGFAIMSLTVAEYISKASFDDCGPPAIEKRLIAATVIVSVCIINMISVRLAAQTQILFTLLKTGGLLVIVAGGIYQMSVGSMGSLPTAFDGSTYELKGLASAIYSGMWAFGGWNNLNYSVEELKNPKRNLPLSIGISIMLVLIIYILVNVSYFTMLSKEEFLSTWAVGVLWAEKVLGKGAILIPIVVACSVFGSINGSALSASRIIFAGARDGNFPEVLSFLNVHTMIPTPSVLLITVLSLIFLTFPGDVGTMIDFTGFANWGFVGMVMVAHIVLRFKMKDSERTFKVPLFIPVIVLVASIYLLVAPLLDGIKTEYIFALVFLGLGIVAYFPFIFFRFIPPGSGAIRTLVQLFLEVSPPPQYVD